MARHVAEDAIHRVDHRLRRAMAFGEQLLRHVVQFTREGLEDL